MGKHFTFSSSGTSYFFQNQFCPPRLESPSPRIDTTTSHREAKRSQTALGAPFSLPRPRKKTLSCSESRPSKPSTPALGCMNRKKCLRKTKSSAQLTTASCAKHKDAFFWIVIPGLWFVSFCMTSLRFFFQTVFPVGAIFTCTCVCASFDSDLGQI